MKITMILFVILYFQALLTSCEGWHSNLTQPTTTITTTAATTPNSSTFAPTTTVAQNTTTVHSNCYAFIGHDQQYFQYDGDRLMFPGNATYLLTKHNSDTRPGCNLRVEVSTNNKLMTATYLEITIGKDAIHMGPKDDLKINGIKTFVPHSMINRYYSFRSGSRYFSILTSCGYSISYYPLVNEVQLRIDENLETTFRGLCGNINGEKDECVSPEGIQLPTLDNRCSSVEFGISWVVPKEDENICIEIIPTPLTCSENNKAVAMGLAYCGLLNLTRNDGLFRHSFHIEDGEGPAGFIESVIPLSEAMFENCTNEVCISLETGDDPELKACRFIEEYVDDIVSQYLDTMPQWRDGGFCAPNCSEHEAFFDYSLHCEPTCGTNALCLMKKTSGCGCIPGYKRSLNTCVPEDSCGCIYGEDDKYLELGASVLDEECIRIYSCQIFDNGTSGVVIGIHPGCSGELNECRPNAAGIYLMVVLSMSCLSILFSVGILSIHHQRGKPRKCPDFLKYIAFSVIAPVLFLKLRSSARKPRRTGGPEKAGSGSSGRSKYDFLEKEHIEKQGGGAGEDGLSDFDYKDLICDSVFTDVEFELRTFQEKQNSINELIQWLQKKHRAETLEDLSFQEWRDVAFVADRLFFVIFLIMTIVATAVILTLRPEQSLTGFSEIKLK